MRKATRWIWTRLHQQHDKDHLAIARSRLEQGDCVFQELSMSEWGINCESSRHVIERKITDLPRRYRRISKALGRSVESARTSVSNYYQFLRMASTPLLVMSTVAGGGSAQLKAECCIVGAFRIPPSASASIANTLYVCYFLMLII